jgi:hypothetical protein
MSIWMVLLWILLLSVSAEQLFSVVVDCHRYWWLSFSLYNF